MASAPPSHFLHDTLPLDPFARHQQTPDDYVEQLSATTGMPHVMVRRNMRKIHGVLSQVDEVLGGLTRGLDLSLLDAGIGRSRRPRDQLLPARRVARRGPAEQLAGRALAVGAGDGAEDAARAEAGQRRALDAVSHDAGVAEGGLPARGVQLLPEDHAGGNEILRRTGRGMVFGDVGDRALARAIRASRSTAPASARWCSAPTPLDDWERYLDVMVDVDRRQRRPLVRQRVGRVGAAARAARSPRRWPSGCAAIAPRAADDEARRSRRSSIRRWPSASRR